MLLRRRQNFRTLIHVFHPTAWNPLLSFVSVAGASSISDGEFQLSPSSQSLRLTGIRGPALLAPPCRRSSRSFLASLCEASSPSTKVGSQSSRKGSQMKNIDIDGCRPDATPKQESDIIDLVCRNGQDFELKLDSMNVSLSDASISRIFRVLNSKRVSALRFFGWLNCSSREFSCNSDIYSLVINNCGLLGDHEGMLRLLNDFSRKHVRLNQNAFGFLPVLLSEDDEIVSYVKEVVDILNKVEGSCRISGIHSLIQMFCTSGCFHMARSVMDLTERKASYYNIMLRERCRRCEFQEARGLIEEMRLVGCDPDAGTYNYLLSSLCEGNRTGEAFEVLKEMQGGDCPPNALTYEIFICYFCKVGKFDAAFEFRDQMFSRGLEPRPSTHAAFLKTYISLFRYEEGYEYVVETSARHRCSSNSIYGSLASLHEKRGNVVIAQDILSEMIERGLRPDSRVYMRVLRHLRLLGRNDMANDLKNKCSKL